MLQLTRTKHKLNTCWTLQLRAISTIRYPHQKQLFLHRQQNTPNAHVVSFSADPTKMPIGTAYLDLPEEDHITPASFSPNKQFFPLLHSVIASSIHDDFTYLVESSHYAGEFMPIFDLRRVPNYQRSPDTEDTFGFVLCEEKTGEIIKGSYQSNAMYTLVTQDGPLILSDHLHEKLVEKLDQE